MELAAMKANRIDAGNVDDFPVGLGRLVRHGTLQLAVFRTKEGAIYALDNRTPHPKGGTLVEAMVSGRNIYCMRDLKIDLVTGCVQAPDTGEVKTYPVQVEDGRVQIIL